MRLGETQTLSHCLLWAGTVPLPGPDSLSGLGPTLPHTLGVHCGATPDPACESHPLDAQIAAGALGDWAHRGGSGREPIALRAGSCVGYGAPSSFCPKHRRDLVG